ncbi:MAG: hypothetical protein QM690_07090 [Sphingobium sp.]
MKRIEQSIALPVRQIVNPVQMAAGSAVAMAGAALLLARLVPLV